MTNGSGDVSYTVKELLARQDVKLDRIEEFARKAASRDEMIALAHRVEKLERESIVKGGQFSLSRRVGVFAAGFTFFVYQIITLAFLLGAHRL